MLRENELDLWVEKSMVSSLKIADGALRINHLDNVPDILLYSLLRSVRRIVAECSFVEGGVFVISSSHLRYPTPTVIFSDVDHHYLMDLQLRKKKSRCT